MASDAQRKAIKKYREKLNKFRVDFSPAEQELWNHLQSQPNKQGYLKNLIREDMKKGGA